jgi:dienelactone hydrolase
MGTLLLDLLTPEEEAVDRVTRELRFDIALLARRLGEATQWVLAQPSIGGRRLGYFGASTGAAAALIAAAERPDCVKAIVSRGGRPDLAGRALEEVWAPTLLIVGGEDFPVIEWNEQALSHLATAEKRLEIVAGATHLFEEPGALEKAAALARSWFKFHLSAWEEPTRAYA